MLNFGKQAEPLQEEQRSLKQSFDRLSTEIDRVRTTFFDIERHCFRGDNNACIAEHDMFKLEIAQIQRQGDKVKNLCMENCASLIPTELMPRDIDSWAVRSKEEYHAFKNYFTCFKPYMQQYLGYMQQEKEVFERANQRMNDLIHQ